MQRDIGGQRDRPNRWHIPLCLQRGRERCLQLPRFGDLVLGCVKDVFVDETLPRERAVERKNGRRNRRGWSERQRLLQQRAAHSRQEAFEFEIGDRGGLQQGEQEGIAANGGALRGRPQRSAVESRRPRLPDTIEAGGKRRTALGEVAGRSVEVGNRSPSLQQRPRDQAAQFRSVAGETDAAETADEDGLGIGRFTQRERLPNGL
jgi:hypothetical protein